MDYDLGYFDEEHCRVEPIQNPFGPNVLPMCPGRTLQTVASPICASWNQIAEWLRRLDPLRRAA